MKRDKLELTAKILATIMSLIVMASTLSLVVKMLIASISGNMDALVYYGVSLGAIGGAMFILWLCSIFIIAQWEKRKDKE